MFFRIFFNLGLITIYKPSYFFIRNVCVPLHVPKYEHYNQPK